MKQFNLEEYLKNPSKKVVTRDGRSVRIICTNRLDENYPVIALVNDEYNEKCYSYSEFGKFENRDCELDLFFAPEKKEGWLNLYKDGNGRVAIGTVYPIESEESAKMASEDKDYVATCKITWEE